MKILFVFHRPINNATCMRMVSCACAMARSGISTGILFLFRGKENWVEPVEDNLSIYYGGRGLSLNFKRVTSLYASIKGFILLKKILHRYDVVFIGGVFYSLQYALARLNKVSICMELSEIPFNLFTGKLLHRFQDVFRSQLAKRVDHLFVISKGLQEFYQDRTKRNPVIVNMFVDFNRFKDNNLLVKNKLITYCGSISTFKDGVDILIKAFSIVKYNHPDAQLRIIGTASDIILSELYTLIDSLQLNDESIEFTGVVDANELVSLLQESFVLALARPDSLQAQYGFPTKLGEYLASGRPSVITKTGEIDLYLTDRIDCIFSKAGDPIDFAKQLDWVLAHPSDAEIIGANGRKTAEKYFSSDKEIIKIVEEIQYEKKYI